MKECLIRSLVLCAALVFALPIVGAVHFVSTGGHDTQGNGSIERPWRTIRKGLLEMAPGDTLYMRGGVYEESRIWDSSTGGYLIQDGYSETQRTVIASYPGERAVFRPTWSPDCSGQPGFGTPQGRAGPKYITFDGFTVDGGMNIPSAYDRPLMKFYSAHFITFTNMHFLNNTNGSFLQLYAHHQNTAFPINARLGLSNIVTSCLFSNVTRVEVKGSLPAAKHPIYVYPATRMIIENSVFRYGHSSAVAMGSIGGQTWEAIVTNMVVRNNDVKDFAHGIRLGKSVGTKVYNNTIRNISVGTHPPGGTSFNSGSAFYVAGLSNVVANNSIYGGHDGILLERALTAYPAMAKASKNLIANNVVWGQARAGIYLEEENGPLGGINTFQNNIAPSIGSAPGSTAWANQVMIDNMIGSQYNPNFKSPPSDLTVLATSIAVDAGVALSEYFSTDFRGVTRHVGAAWDIGFVEFQQSSYARPLPPQGFSRQ